MSKRPGEPVIDVDELRAVFHGILENPNLFLDGSLKLSSTFFPTAPVEKLQPTFCLRFFPVYGRLLG